jgi:acylphosphatase
VEVFAVGSEEVLQELEDFMRGGPPAAVVSAVQVREAPEDFPGHGFEIRR